MSALPDGEPVEARFADDFVSTDQEVSDLSAPKPETRWCLLELPKEQLQALEGGSCFYFQAQDLGTADSGVALSTETATFGLEFLENSNSIFLAAVQGGEKPGDREVTAEAVGATDVGSGGVAANLSCVVFAQCRGQIIVKQAKVNPLHVRELLAKQALGAETPGDGDREGAAAEPFAPLTRKGLEYEIAASPAELGALLQEGPYVEVDGVWRLLPTTLEREILDAAVSLVAARGWRAEAVDGEALLEEVQQHLGKSVVPTLAVLRKALRSVEADAPPVSPSATPPSAAEARGDAEGKTLEDTPTATGGSVQGAVAPTGDSQAGSDAGGTRLALDKARVTRFQALQLLRTPPAQVRERFRLPAPGPRPKRARHAAAGAAAAGGRDGGPALQLGEFAAALQELMGATEPLPQEEVLTVVGDRGYVDEMEGTIHALDPTILPTEPRERLARLLDIQSHWKPEPLAALIAPCMGAGQKVETWLIKNTRAVYIEMEQGKEERMLVKKFGT